jgi:VWFA-related protein
VTRGLPSLLLALLPAFAAGTAVRAQQPVQGPPVVFRSGVELVRVDALVVRDNGVVKGLQPADFELRDNGILQEVVSASLEQIPIDALFVFDLSGSVSEANARLLRGAAWLFLDGLTPQDRAGLITFNARPVVAQPLAARLELVRTALASIAGGGSTALNDAVYAALRSREPGETRGAIVIFTDGADNISWLSAAEVVEAAKRSDVIVHTVAVGVLQTAVPGPWGRAMALGPADNPLLHDLGVETGGQVWSAGWPELAGAFRAVLDDLRSRYLLTYNPSNVAGSGWHTLEVKVKRAGVKVTARTGYYRSLQPPGQ